MSRIPVAIISDGGNFSLVSKYFDSVYFDVFNISSKPTALPLDYERHTIRAALMEAAERSPLEYCIIIKDTSITSFTPDEITKAIHASRQGDIVYLTRWEDRCDLFVDEATIDISDKSTIKLVKTISPRGLQAFMFNPKIRDFIRGSDFRYETNLETIFADLIQKGIIKAYAYMPNLFEYDVVSYATTMSEFNRVNLCRDATIPNPDPLAYIGAETYFYLTAIILFFILAGWGMYLLGPQPRKKNNEMSLASSDDYTYGPSQEVM